MNIAGVGSNIIAQAIGSTQSTQSTQSNSAKLADQKATKVAQQFEQMVLSQLLSYADTDNDMSDDMFGGGAGEKAFKPFLYDEYAKGFTQAGGIGITSAIKSEIIKIQEAAQKTAAQK